MHKLFCLAVLLSVVMTAPLFGGTVYSNGPINGTTDAWTINFGFVVSDTFTVGSGGTTVNGLSFGAWAEPGDVLENADVRIASSEFGGHIYFDGLVSFTQSACSSNQYGYNVCTESGAFGPLNLAAGTYWVNLSNAVVNTGDPIYWDENSGPSRALDWPRPNAVGTIPSESFTILGGETTCGIGNDCALSSTAPEPGSFALLCAGGMTLFGLLRRKLF